MRVAVIDIGTNTLRLLVGDASPGGGYLPVAEAQRITRLGQALLPDYTLKPGPIGRTLDTLIEFAELARSRGAEHLEAVGTSALREARNRDRFIQTAGRRGIPLRVISGAEEARLALRGVRVGLPDLPDRTLLLDIGGGSTELLLTEGTGIQSVASVELGSVGLTELFLKSDPPAPEELAALRRAVGEGLCTCQTAGMTGSSPRPCLVGTAGTITTLVAIELGLGVYRADLVNGQRLSREQVAGALCRLAALPLERRRRVPGLEPERADIIVAGAAICLEVMEHLGFEEMRVSDGGLREGALLDLIDRTTGNPRES